MRKSDRGIGHQQVRQLIQRLYRTAFNGHRTKLKILVLAFVTVALVVKFNYKNLTHAATSGVEANPQELVKYRVGVQGVNLEKAEDLNLVEDLGVGYVRFDVRWDEAENGTKEVNTSIYDPHFSNLLTKRIRAIASLNFNNPSYDAASIFSAFTPPQIDGFSRFAFAMVKRYQGRKDITWEIYNEPNQPGFWSNPNATNYMDLAAATSLAIRSADPEAKIFGPALGHIPLAQRPQPSPWSSEYLDFPYLQRCLDEGLLPLVNKVSIHPYPGEAPEAVIKTYELLRSLLKKYPGGSKIPLSVSETGYSTQGDYRVSEQEQAMWLPRQILVNLSAHISPTIIWSLRDMSAVQGESNEVYGLIRHDGSKKPAYGSVKALMENIGELYFDQRIPTASEDWALRFTNGEQTVIAAWTTAANHSMTIAGQTVFITSMPTYVRVANRVMSIFDTGGETLLNLQIAPSVWQTAKCVWWLAALPISNKKCA
jgi:polysaccharide biosynthesis protein PslG